MNIKDTARRALLFVAEGSELAEAAIAKIDESQPPSLELIHELEFGLAQLELGRDVLRGTLSILAINNEHTKLPWGRAK